MSSKEIERLGTGKIGKLLFEFSLPAIIGLLVNAVYNTVDRIFVGQGVDSLGIAGISIAMPLMLAGSALAMLIGAGANTIFSIKLGEGRTDEVQKIIGNAFTLLLIVSGLFAAISLVFLDKIIVHVLGASNTIFPYAKTYSEIILLGSVFNAFGFGLSFFIRSDGHPRIAMYTQLAGALANLILDPIFIFVCKRGIAGAAWATIIAQFISFILVIAYFNSKFTQLRFRIQNMKIRFKLALKIISLGLAPFAGMSATSFVIGFINHSLYIYGGDIAIASMGIAVSIKAVICMPIQGLSIGAQPIIGYNYGAKFYKRTAKTYKWAVLSGTIYAGAAFLLIQIFPHIFIRVFTQEKGDILEMAVRCLRVSALAFPIISFQYISSNYFQSVGKPVQSIIISLAQDVLFVIILLLTLPKIWGLNGVFYVTPSTDFLTSILIAAFMLFELKRLKKLIQKAHLKN